MLTGSKLASAATKRADVQIACSHLVLLNKDGNLSTKDLANALAPFAERDPKVHCTRPSVVVEYSSLEKVTATYSSAAYARGDGAVRHFGIVEGVERQFLRTLRRFPLPSSVDEATNSLRIAIRLAGHAAKRAPRSRNMADGIFDRCTVHGVKLSFTSQAQLGAHPQNA